MTPTNEAPLSLFCLEGKMKGTKYTTKLELMKKAEELVSAKTPFSKLDKNGRLSSKNKGDLGQIVEEGWFEYTPNNDKDPDFPEAGVELKVFPYKIIRGGRVSAKERLVCDIINYVEEVDKTFETSAFWHKCKCILLLTYLWTEGVPKGDMFVDDAILIQRYPDEDLCIIKQDWETIIQKIREGKAEEISEGDTLYLSACTKGANANSLRRQPHSRVLAMQRAYSLKTTYMTRLLRKYVHGDEEDSHIIKDWRVLKTQTFENYVLQKFEPYINKNIIELADSLYIDLSKGIPKNVNNMITRRILGILSNRGEIIEFENANIRIKNVPVDARGKSTQSTSFPYFKAKEIIQQEWEDSDLYEQVVTAKFLYVIYQTTDEGNTYLKKAAFWNMPSSDVEELHRVWNKTVEILKNGVEFRIGNDGRVYNNLPASSDSRVAHVRPHSDKRVYFLKDGTKIEPESGDLEKYGDELPDKQWMTRQCFWLNKSYTSHIIHEILGDDDETSKAL